MMLWLWSEAHLAHRHARNSCHSQNCYSTAACRFKMLLWLEPGAHLRKSIWYISAFLLKCNVRRFTYKSTHAKTKVRWAHLAHRHARNSSHGQNCDSTAACRLKMLLWLEPGAHLQKSICYIFVFLVKHSVRRFTYKSTIAFCHRKIAFRSTGAE